jgi:hypothetical protein
MMLPVVATPADLHERITRQIFDVADALHALGIGLVPLSRRALVAQFAQPAGMHEVIAVPLVPLDVIDHAAASAKSSNELV